MERVGPSTGLPTRTAQSDLLTTALLSHGDTRHPMFFPCSPRECFSMSIEAFDFAEKFQTPVFVITDLDLGMNNWTSDPFDYPETPINRGKVLSAEDLERLGGFARYRDVDGDGVGYRTLPGTNHPAAAYFTRGSGHNDKARYTEREDDYVNNMDRLAHKFEVMRKHVPEPVVQARRRRQNRLHRHRHLRLRRARKLRPAARRIRHRGQLHAPQGLPFTEHMLDFIRRHDRVYVVDQNRDAQLLGLMRLELDPALIAKLRSVRYYGGLPLDARTVTDEVVKQEGK